MLFEIAFQQLQYVFSSLQVQPKPTSMWLISRTVYSDKASKREKCKFCFSEED